ncbi:MAG: MBL fold metallo-hydrolase [Propionibacteriaceae bacterium]|nr:MBL fold metallo-hydrolase [Propionibacteriaceae bacterium]
MTFIKDNPDNLVLTSPAITLRRVAVSALDNNVYLLTSRTTGRQVLIDAADDAPAIAALLAQAAGDGPGAHVAFIVTTHRHHDHIRALAEVAKATGAPSLAGGDAAAIAAATGVPTEELRPGDQVAAPELALEAITLRGHTPGSVALAYREPGQPVQLFTGDSLFPGGVGNTGGDPARFAQLLGDVEARLFDRFPDDTAVHPGHGQPTTLGAERPHLAEWRARGW